MKTHKYVEGLFQLFSRPKPAGLNTLQTGVGKGAAAPRRSGSQNRFPNGN